LGLGVPAP